MYSPANSSASFIFRGINFPARSDYGTSTEIADLAENYASKNVAPITQALNDFTSLFRSFHGSDSSNLDSSDVSGPGNSDNMFKSDEGKDIVSRYIVYQSNIFLHNLEHDDGLRYAPNGSNYKKSALNFANADIAAIEKPYYIAYRKKGAKQPNGKLDSEEIKTGNHSEYKYYGSLMHRIDLDGKGTEVSAKEYASYLIAADGLRYDKETEEYKFDFKDIDGLITEEEAKLATSIDDETFKAFASEVYDKYYTSFFK